jgi:hypothetical protein
MSTAVERRAEGFIKKHLTRSVLKSSSFRSNAEKNNLGNWCALDPFRQIVIGGSVKAHNTGIDEKKEVFPARDSLTAVEQRTEVLPLTVLRRQGCYPPHMNGKRERERHKNREKSFLSFFMFPSFRFPFPACLRGVGVMRTVKKNSLSLFNG